MPKEERKRLILGLLAETGLALPPRVTYENLALRGATFSYKTVHRHLREAEDDGLVENPPNRDDYYQITDEGRDYLEGED